MPALVNEPRSINLSLRIILTCLTMLTSQLSSERATPDRTACLISFARKPPDDQWVPATQHSHGKWQRPGRSWPTTPTARTEQCRLAGAHQLPHTHAMYIRICIRNATQTLVLLPLFSPWDLYLYTTCFGVN